MRRDDIVTAVGNVLQTLDASGAVDYFESVLQRDGNSQRAGGGVIALDVFRKLHASFLLFGAAEQKILEIFDLTQLDEPEFWVEVLTDGFQSPVTHGLPFKLNNFRRFVPKILEMLETDALREKRRATKESRDPDRILTVILIEDRGQASKPERLVEVIEAVVELYAVFVAKGALPPDTLSVIGCDSGSDKSFDFLGLPDAIKGIKELILEVWDRVVFHRQTQTEQNLNVALRSLTVVEEISRLQEQGSLGPEDAERLRHKAVSAASQLLNCGVLIPEIERHTKFNPRVLMTPQPRLIAGVVDVPVDNDRAVVDDIAQEKSRDVSSRGLTQAEEELLRTLLEKARGANGGTAAVGD
jgi:hypothetical protein